MNTRSPRRNFAPVFVWTPEAVAQLKALWPDPLNTVNKIGAVFGLGKSAISGKARRLHLTPKGSGKLTKLPPDLRATILLLKKGQKPADVAPAPKPVISITEIRSAVADIQRSIKKCQFPTSRNKPFLFCEAMALDGRVYCEIHCQAAYVNFGARHRAQQMETTA
jgi:hypothetical protein